MLKDERMGKLVDILDILRGGFGVLYAPIVESWNVGSGKQRGLEF